MKKKYLETIVKHYESCLDAHGDTHLGVDWPKIEDVVKRDKVMLELLKFGKHSSKYVSLLDFGCGAGHLLQYIMDEKIDNIEYAGLDISEKFVNLCRSKFPSTTFYQLDILDQSVVLPEFDYVIMNGVFTEKREMSFQNMWEYFCSVLTRIFSFTKIGISFNVMSKAVQWEREDLFHVPTDLLIDFLTSKLSRNFIIRNDYGLYEYTTYLYK
ncbi:MAG TPA: class I SAM-dependent methyltransferase [Aquella sp.]|nr:class I SAM-dependent methyltransferase [Aquella sp.]